MPTEGRRRVSSRKRQGALTSDPNLTTPPGRLSADLEATLSRDSLVPAISRRLIVGSLGAVLVIFLGLTIYFGMTRRATTLESWIEFVMAAFGLAASAVLSLLFYEASNRLPAKISVQLVDLVENLQSPLTGYELVTSKIIDVCDSAANYYLAATRMPLIGAISDGPFCQQYQTALTTKVLAGVRTELVCLEDEPLYEFVRTASPQGFPVESSETIIREFLEQQLPSYVRQAGAKVELGRMDAMPIQMAIADGERAILYFSPNRDLTRISEIRGFYTTNRDIISALMIGFYYIQKESREQFSTLSKDGESHVSIVEASVGESSSG